MSRLRSLVAVVRPRSRLPVVHRENSTLVVGGLGVAAAAILAQHALRAYNAAQAANPTVATVPG